ncbi:MAG: 50S ribosomal protein L10 [bacterium]|nr:50S ribosomal protein L10 [bacterium]
MVKQYKVDEVQNLVGKLQARPNFILTDYSGVKVGELSQLRRSLREKNAEYKVVKNNLFKLALKEAGYQDITDHLKGPIAVAFMGEEIGETAKVLKDFATAEKEFSYSAGILDNVLYEENKIKDIAGLPSKEVVLSQVLQMINSPAQGIAMGMNQIMASLARGINAVAEKSNG